MLIFRHLIRRAFSTTSSTQTHLKNQSLQPKTFFNRVRGDRDPIVNRLCKDRRYTEAVRILCEQKRLKEAVEILDHHVKQSYSSLYTSLLLLCIQKRGLKEGSVVHRHMKGLEEEPGVFLCNRVVEMYAKCGSMELARKVFDEMRERDLCSWNVLVSGYAYAGMLDEARQVFDEMGDRDSFSWTAMISGYARSGRGVDALELFRLMQCVEGCRSNKFTVSSVISAAACCACLNSGKEIHGHIIRAGLDSDEVVWSSLSDLYGKCGSLEQARYIFNKALGKDVVSWTAMIDRYFGEGRREEGYQLFSNLMESRVKPNDFTFAGVLNACAGHAAEDIGKQVHGYMMRVGFDLSSFAASALVHMYSKCGNMTNAKRVLHETKWLDLVSWTSLINGYAQNGQPEEALQSFELLLETGIRPDHVTFVAVLSACTHAGLVDKGLEYFESIKEKYGLTYTGDHYACVLDMLARSGRFKEAEDIINKIPMKPNKFLWASVLGGCRIHGNIDLAARAAEALFEIEPENPATYITLANIYATAGKWGEVSNIRKIMQDRGLTKKPGMSWIKIKREVHVFLIGDTSHPMFKEICDYLGELSKKMREEGYVPDTKAVLHDVEEEQKEQNITYHSEKLAVAFGLIVTPPGTSLKIYKNLRTCVDCHSALKFISKISKRRLVVRDSNRFHCFEEGRCSCKDYW
uniref:DYW domain-containing protein n=1 Tax=Kalanchoe fedtschenkoi TaxID=63787 RepID=A0A7N0VH88_KALFE